MRLFRLPILCLILSVAASGVCFLAAGASFGLLLGSSLLLTLILPPLFALSKSQIELLAAVGATTIGTSAIWLVFVEQRTLSITQWAQASAVLLALVAALASLVFVLVRMRLPGALASATATVTALLWLTWPIWASTHISSTSLLWPIRLHPLLVMNGCCRDLGIWTQEPVAYHLTNLGQDIAYSLPNSIVATLLLHLGISTVLLVASEVFE